MRAVLVALLLLIAPATARAWSDPVALPDAAAVALATDGTQLTAWTDASGLHAQIGAAAPVLLDPSRNAYAQVLASGNEFAAVWTTDDATKVVTGSAGAGFGPPASLKGYVARLVGDRAGDMAIMTGDAEAWSVSYRPAGGSFGPPVVSPAPVRPYVWRVLAVDDRPWLALSPAGETLVAWSTPEVHVASRARQGAFGPTVTLPGEPLSGYRSGPVAALDAHGRALALWSGADAAQVDVRDGSGVWREATGVRAASAAYPQADTGEDGQGVVAFSSSDGYQASSVSLATGVVGPATDYPLTVAPEGAPPPFPDPSSSTGYPALSATAGGGATLTWNRFREVLVARRAADGTFGAPEIAACQTLGAFPEPIGDGAGLLVRRYPDARRALVRDTPGPARTCPPPEAERGPRHAVYSPRRVVAGEPVRIRIVNLRRANAAITGNAWDMGPRVVANAEPALTYAFPRPGRAHWKVTSKQTYEAGAEGSYRFRAAVDVYARATLRVDRARRIFASALTFGPRRTLTVVTGGRRRTLRAGLQPRRVRLKARGRVRLLQGGRVVASAR